MLCSHLTGQFSALTQAVGRVPVAGTNYTDIATGDQICALNTHGAPACDSVDGVLGFKPPTHYNFTQIISHSTSFCGILKNNGSVLCWNLYGNALALEWPGPFDSLYVDSYATQTTVPDSICAVRHADSYSMCDWLSPPVFASALTRVVMGQQQYNNQFGVFALSPTGALFLPDGFASTNPLPSAISASFKELAVTNLLGNYDGVCALRADGAISCYGDQSSDSYGVLTPPSGHFTQLECWGVVCAAVRTNTSVAYW